MFFSMILTTFVLTYSIAMQFKEIKGNDILKAKLAAMVDRNRTGHAIMLEEKSGYGALPMAMALIQYLNCQNRHDGDSCGECSSCRRISHLQHPDVHFAFPVNVTAKSGSEKKPVSDTFISVWKELMLKNPYFTEEELNTALGIEDKAGIINVNEAKEILNQMNLRSFEGGNKYMIIWLPERMNTEASNKLLKIVEEPFPGSYFIFITQAPEKVIDTIRSRCLRLQLQPIPLELQPDTEEYLELFRSILDAGLSRDLINGLKTAETLAALGREHQKRFCLFSESFLREIMISGMKLGEKSETGRQAALYSGRLPESFYEKGFTLLENARTSIESNVNAKMVFTNLANLFWLNLKK